MKEGFTANIMLSNAVKPHSQVQMLPGAFSKGEILLHEEADVLQQQLSVAL